MTDLSAADENYALAITSGDASSSSISPYPADLRVCSGSYNEAGTNRIDVLGIDPELIADPEAYAREYYNNEEEYDSTSGDETIPDRKQDLVKLASQKIRYPPTKVAFGPLDLVHHPTFEAGSEVAHIVAATTDSLRIFKLKEASTEPRFSEPQTYSQHVGRENRRSKAELAKLVTLKEDASGEVGGLRRFLYQLLLHITDYQFSGRLG